MIEELLEDEGNHPSLLTASIVVIDEDGDTVLEFPFSEALITSPSGVIDTALSAAAARLPQVKRKSPA